MVPSLPPLQLSSSSDAKGSAQSGFDNSGFNVNFGAGSVGGLPTWAMLAAAGAVAWMLLRKR